MLPAHLSIFWRPRPLPQGTWRLGLFCFYIRTSARLGRLEAFAISIRGLLIAGALIGVLGYVGGTAALAHHLRQRPHNLITWRDCLLLPVRWDTIREKQGRALIAAGQEAVAAGKWPDAVAHLTSGLRRYPADLEARQQLAFFRFSTFTAEAGFTLLLDGIEQPGSNRNYVGSILKYAKEHARGDAALTACIRAEAAWGRAGRVTDVEWAVAQRVTILGADDRVEEALALAATHPRPDGPIARAAILIATKAGRIDEALAMLDRAEQAGALPAEWHTDQRRAFAFAAGRRPVPLAAVIAKLEARHGRTAEFLELATITALTAGDLAAADRWFELFRLQHGTRAEALVAMADALSVRGDVARVSACVELARQHGLMTPPLWLCWFETALIAGDFETAARAATELEPADRVEMNTLESLLIRRARLLSAALRDPADVAQVALINLADQSRIPLIFMTTMPPALARAGRHATALRLAEIGVRRFPASKPLAAARDTAAGVMKVRQQEALAIRTDETSAAQAGNAAGLLADPALFLSALATASSAADWPRVITLLSAARHARPGWLAENEATLARAEIAARIARREDTELAAAVRRFLNGTATRNDEALEIVRKLDSAGDRALARPVLAEIVRREPDEGPAWTLQQLWQKQELATVPPPSPPAP